jgi:hypothetical protein
MIYDVLCINFKVDYYLIYKKSFAETVAIFENTTGN